MADKHGRDEALIRYASLRHKALSRRLASEAFEQNEVPSGVMKSVFMKKYMKQRPASPNKF